MQAYSDPKRASDPNALPDLEIWHASEHDLCVDSPAGWYWQTCFPGCLPDSDPIGPFASEDEALADARKAKEQK